MPKVETYRQVLASLDDWEAYLIAESRLPGPRGNLELAFVVADMGDAERFERMLDFDPARYPTNTPGEFLAFCGVLGLGKLLAQGELHILERLRAYASDPRWRVREAVAMALQRYGSIDMPGLIAAMQGWSQGSALEQRAAAAALCEPGLLTQPEQAERVLGILQAITVSIGQIAERKGEDFKALRKGLGYCWSVAVAACPDPGKSIMERWLSSQDPDIRWIMKQNLRKKRLQRLDPQWAARCLAQLDHETRTT